MSFYASNNRILVTDNSATVFDTNDDMPHILGQSTFTQEVVFPTPVAYTVNTGLEVVSVTVPEYQCTYNFQQVCTTNYVCTYDYVNVCTPSFSCTTDYMGNLSCGTVDSCSYQMVSNCGNVTDCRYENVQSCSWGSRTDTSYVQHYGTAYYPLDWSTSIVLARLPNLIDCNFLLSKVSSVKNYSNEISLMTKVSSLGPDTFAFQGSALVEIAGQGGANSSMSRIISIYPDNVGKNLILEARHSSIAMSPPGVPNDVYNGGIQSSYTLTITVYYGRFR